MRVTKRTDIQEIKEYSFSKEELQRILNVYFEIVVRTQMCSSNRSGEDCSKFWNDRDAVMKWAGEAIAYAGLPSNPMGSSWGALDTKKMEEAAD